MTKTNYKEWTQNDSENIIGTLEDIAYRLGYLLEVAENSKTQSDNEKWEQADKILDDILPTVEELDEQTDRLYDLALELE